MRLYGGNLWTTTRSADAEELAEAIVDLYQNPEKRQSLVDNAALLYDRYKSENQRAIYQKSYRSLLGIENQSVVSGVL